MAALGRFLQIAGLIIVPLGLVHFYTAQDHLPESSLMTWELGLLGLGALCFIVGWRLGKGKG